MFDGQKANPFWEALRHRHKLAFNIAAGVILLFGIVAFLTRQYSATAVLALNPHASLNSNDQPRSATEMAWTALTDQQIVSLIYQFHLDNGIVQLFGENQGFTYLRSKISLHQIETPGSPSAEIAVSFTGQSRSSSLAVANAVAGILAKVKAPLIGEPAALAAAQPEPATAPPSTDLEKARAELDTLAQNQGNMQDMQKELQGRIKTSAQMLAARLANASQLAQLAGESERITLAAAQARPATAPAVNPARAALVERIKNAQAHLAQLRERYTEQYPDIQDAKANLARLEAQLNRMPPEPLRQNPVKTPPPDERLRNIANQETQLQEDQQRLGQAIQTNQYRIEVLRKRIVKSSTLTQDYASAEQRYDALLQAQQAQTQQAPAVAHSASPAGANQQMVPLFIVIQSAVTAEASGIAAKPAFWLLGLLAALFAASLIVFVVEHLSPTLVEKDISARSVRHRA